MNLLATHPHAPRITRQSVRIGFNHNVAYRGRKFHVQTEDSGREHGHIFTHVFLEGVVVSSSKVAYASVGAEELSTERILRLMQDSHKAMIRRLCSGALDERLARFTLVPASVELPPEPESRPEPPNTQLDRINKLKDTINMANVNDSLMKLSNEVTGSLGVALVDYESGMCLGMVGNGINLEVAAAGNMEVVRAKQRVMSELGIQGDIEDILITLNTQYHIIRPLRNSMFLYLAFDRKQGNLAMARHKMATVSAELVV